MASEEGRPNLPARSPEQRLHALAKANQVRSARAQLKRDLAAGTVELAYRRPGIGPARASRALAHCRIAEAKTIAGLRGRQRAELTHLLHR